MADRAVGIPIVREGLPFVGAVGGAAALAWGAGMAAPAAVLASVTLFTGWFFRNPRRHVPSVPNGIVSPGDGRIVGIEEEYEPKFFKDQTLRVSIFLNVFDVHVNRIPCEGTVEAISYQPGLFFAANRPEATLQNEQNALLIRSGDGFKVLCVQVAGLIARRIVCWASPGESVSCGERYGLIRFGSRVDLYLPLGSHLTLEVGHYVKGGATLLGTLPQ